MSKFKPPISRESTPRLNNDTVSEIHSSRSVSTKHELSNSTTTMYSGEQVNKGDKILTLIGMIEELICYLGIIKVEHFDPSNETKLDIDSSAKMFLNARITQIQETLIDIQYSVGTTKKVQAKFEYSRFQNGIQKTQELMNEIQLMNDVDLDVLKTKDKPTMIIPGTSLIESQLLFSRTICRKIERQLCTLKQSYNVEDTCISYINKLSDYLIVLAVHILHMKGKDVLKKVSRTNNKYTQ
jgi:cob(I)alamin adenosyltransferase